MQDWSKAEVTMFRGEYGFLSNFWPCQIKFEGFPYVSTEHAYQAAKTLDSSLRVAISKCETPGKAKRMGKQVEVRSDWEMVKVQIMRALVTQKFKDPELRARLLATGLKTLVEGNSWGDRFWGATWGNGNSILLGKNTLGVILMNVRHEIRMEVPSGKGWRIRRSERLFFPLKEGGPRTFITFWRREGTTWAMQAMDATCYAKKEDAESDAFFLATQHPESNIDIAEW